MGFLTTMARDTQINQYDGHGHGPGDDAREDDGREHVHGRGGLDDDHGDRGRHPRETAEHRRGSDQRVRSLVHRRAHLLGEKSEQSPEAGAHEHVGYEHAGRERAAEGDGRDEEEVRQEREDDGGGEELLAVQLVPGEQVLHDALLVLQHQRGHLAKVPGLARVLHEGPGDVNRRRRQLASSV